MHQTKFNQKNKQAGLVSLLVTMLIMIVISLIVLGFAKNTRREQRQSLDRQLFSQANYAAETGINDIAKYIKAQQDLGITVTDFDNCGVGPAAKDFIRSVRPYPNNTVGANNIMYSCALINPKPPELIWQNISLTESLAFPFNPVGGANSEINISWQDADTVASDYLGCHGGATIPPTDVFKPQASWGCQSGLLRIDITPTSGSLTRAGLIDTTKNFVLYPVAGAAAGNINFTALDHGNIIPVQCSASATPRHCKIKITNASANSYHIRIRPIYKSASIFVTGDAGRELKDAQAIVDVTGKANDILKRLQVRLPINALESDTNSTIDFALQSIDSICKKAAIIPGAASPVKNRGPVGEPSCP